MKLRLPAAAIVLLLLLSSGCRKKPAAASSGSIPGPATPTEGTPAPAPSVYEAGSASNRLATAQDRQFKTWTAAFVRGTAADKAKARTEIAAQPPEVRAEFEKFCQANLVKTD